MKDFLQTPVQFPCGLIMKNKFMLAPLTNTQSFEDGRLSEDEYQWLTMRAKGQFGLVMTCASHVQASGKGFPGQLGIFSDDHIEGHKRLSEKIKSYGSLAVVQLHHAGMRSPEELIQQKPLCPSNNEKHGAREISLEEIQQLKYDFINAAKRAQKSGYDGVEVHGAHGYILAQFLSSSINNRSDNYGGSLENRSRILFEIVNGIRNACGEQFLLGVRLSPERFGLKLSEIKQVCERLVEETKIDFLDVSLWDVYKQPEEKEHQHKSLLEHFTALDLKNVHLTVAGNIRNGEDVQKVLNSNVDFVTIGRSAILHHNFPEQVIKDINFKPTEIPVSKAYLKNEGLGENFIDYMSKWSGFVNPD
ncbi:NADH:flavin oxidoreductase [uncultured Tenacibaculum sp.]|uniref:NADH:flavin oxidoreductase n=1 Tax=uncultured Tenacibaculum sp. TaxID=174713 RepID=UPI0026173B6D|nr:NADH:flavin oxidoreductase [uncultured Tenacibaculum sp.]